MDVNQQSSYAKKKIIRVKILKIQDSIELRFTTVVSTLHPNFKSWEKYADEVFNRTDGKVKIVLYPTGTLNDPMDTYNAVKNGLADIGCAPVGYSASIMPLNKLYGDALMGIPNATEAAGIWTESFKNMPELQKELEDVCSILRVVLHL